MTNRNQSLFFTALALTILTHFIAFSPIATWLSRELIPLWTDDSIEIDLTEIQSNPSPKPKPSSKKSIEAQPQEEKPERIEPIDDLLKPLPESKKKLDPTLREDPAPPLKPDSPRKPEEKTAPKESSPPPAVDETTEEEPAVSPMFLRKPEQKEKIEEPAAKEEKIPDEIRETFREGSPEKTEDENLEFSMNTYQWTFERYMENWAIDIQKWWKAPLDYAMGNVPEGGKMWIQLQLSKSGKLLGYRILESDVTAEMELMVIQALVGSLARPSLPEAFPEGRLIINWHFIYPPMRPQLDMRR